ncbi:MAG: pyridoxal phosphate-dependent aminotransferase [Clostridia bacterium]|nr:pyridoxal phosphate-dependent aminotransferase [Clostridia bacterium]
MILSKKVASIKPSVTLEISAKAKALKKEGKDIIAFTAGEPDFNTPDYIIKEAERALVEGKTKYTPTAGIPELKKAIVKKLKAENNLEYKESNIVVSSGAKSSLYHAFEAILNEGDEVIIPAPYWITYVEQVGLAGGVCKIVNTDEKSGYKLIKEQFEGAITPKTKCVLINSPCNPTGVVYTKDELLELARVAEKHNLIIISDEVYEKLVFDGEEHVSIASLTPYAKEHTVVINGVSKTYAMTGWRIGYMACPEEIASAVSAMQGHTTSNACSFAQYASATAIEGGHEFVDYMVREFDYRRKALVEGLSLIDGIRLVYPKGAFYVFMDVSAFFGKSYHGKVITGSVSFAEALLEGGVAVIPGLAFGDDNSVRLAYTVSGEDIYRGIDTFKAFIAELN